jgi:hypothetical protein
MQARRASYPGDEVAKALFGHIAQRAEAALASEPLTRRMEGRRLLTTSRTVLQRVADLGMVWQMTGDPRMPRRALAEVRAAAAFTDWNPDHFLDVGEMAYALALALDWCGGAWTESERREAVQALMRHAVEPGLEIIARDEAFWLHFTNNWNAVCYGGLAAAALAVRDAHPEPAARLLALARERLPHHGHGYAPEGAYVEGASYWSYGTSYHVLAAELLRRGTGDDAGLAALPGFLPSALYRVHVVNPLGQPFRYGDTKGDGTLPPVIAWFASHPGAHAALGQRARDAARRGFLSHLRERPDRFAAFGLLWLPPAPSGDTMLPPAWRGSGPNPVVFWRERWDDPDALWFGAKGGRATLPHGHLDAGSFELTADGVAWIIDPGSIDYGRAEAAGIDIWNAGRHAVLAHGPESHALPRFDGATPDPASDNALLPQRTGGPFAEFDLTRLHPGATQRHVRTFDPGPGRSVTVTDTITGLRAPGAFRFTLPTQADIVAVDGGWELRSNGRVLRVSVDAPGAVRLEQRDLAAEVEPWARPLPGLRRVDLVLDRPPADFVFRVRFVPAQASG